MKTINGHLQVYQLQILGRCIEDLDQQYPIHFSEWTTDFKSIVNEYFKAKVKDSDSEDGYYTEVFQDCQVYLFSIDINVEEFETSYELKFDIENEDVQDCIPYYCNYDFNTVAEKIIKFKK